MFDPTATTLIVASSMFDWLYSHNSYCSIILIRDTRVVDIILCGRLSLIYIVYSIPWLLIYLVMIKFHIDYRLTSNISCTLAGNRIVDNSDVVGAAPVGTAPTTSSFST